MQSQLCRVCTLDDNVIAFSFTGGMPGAVVDWRQRLESQRGAVFATELRNNSNKLSKWTAAALLSGVDMIKLG